MLFVKGGAGSCAASDAGLRNPDTLLQVLLPWFCGITGARRRDRESLSGKGPVQSSGMGTMPGGVTVLVRTSDPGYSSSYVEDAAHKYV